MALLFAGTLSVLGFFTQLLKPEQPETPKRKPNHVCVVGCTPYVNPSVRTSGILKFEAMVEYMAETCEVMVHIGDTKAGAAVCNKTLMSGPIHTMTAAAKRHGSAVTRPQLKPLPARAVVTPPGRALAHSRPRPQRRRSPSCCARRRCSKPLPTFARPLACR